jgi:hypothetical protein
MESVSGMMYTVGKRGPVQCTIPLRTASELERFHPYKLGHRVPHDEANFESASIGDVLLNQGDELPIFYDDDVIGSMAFDELLRDCTDVVMEDYMHTDSSSAASLASSPSRTVSPLAQTAVAKPRTQKMSSKPRARVEVARMNAATQTVKLCTWDEYRLLSKTASAFKTSSFKMKRTSTKHIQVVDNHIVEACKVLEQVSLQESPALMEKLMSIQAGDMIAMAVQTVDGVMKEYMKFAHGLHMSRAQLLQMGIEVPAYFALFGAHDAPTPNLRCEEDLDQEGDENVFLDSKATSSAPPAAVAETSASVQSDVWMNNANVLFTNDER